jgi:hypothetical protein
MSGPTTYPRRPMLTARVLRGLRIACHRAIEMSKGSVLRLSTASKGDVIVASAWAHAMAEHRELKREALANRGVLPRGVRR